MNDDEPLSVRRSPSISDYQDLIDQLVEVGGEIQQLWDGVALVLVPLIDYLQLLQPKLVEVVMHVYRQHNAPYGDTFEGALRWLREYADEHSDAADQS